MHKLQARDGSYERLFGYSFEWREWFKKFLFASGGAMQFRPLIIGAVCCWVLAVVAYFLPFELQLLCLAAASTRAQFSSVRCGASSRTDVNVSAPSAIAPNTTGNRRAARAVSMRLKAAASERWSSCVQYVKSDEHPWRK